jgi:hypothetical protein
MYEMSINDFIYAHQFTNPQQKSNTIEKPIEEKKNMFNEEFEDEVIDLQYIIKNKPPTNKVREFMRANLESIKSEEQELFDK